MEWWQGKMFQGLERQDHQRQRFGPLYRLAEADRLHRPVRKTPTRVFRLWLTRTRCQLMPRGSNLKFEPP